MKQCSFLDLAAQRYSVRNFTTETVPKTLLEQLLQAGHLAPTACNCQPQRILVLDSQEALAKLSACTPCHFNAPAALLVCTQQDACWTRSFDGKESGEIDASIVTTHLMLAAHALGLGSTWVMHFDPTAIREAYDIPANIVPVALLVVGFPAPNATPSPSHKEYHAPADLVFWNHF